MIEFFDINGNKVMLCFERDAFPLRAWHVLVLCRYQGNWLLTKHKERGLEFPGGKLEQKESVEDAAFREVYEETGGIVKNIYYIGEYYVNDEKNGPFVKAICFADIEKLESKKDYLETSGPIIKSNNLKNELKNSEYSFIMKDKIVELSLEAIEKHGLLNKGDKE
ncbi:MAG TPA: nucleoside triphosphatase YtkD [Bacillaceae bacterium]|nr:nucleoside triphosphatase YtkD [Paenibacillus bovis]HLU21585.1 nucleoside triphosphatase YtkD [Bacillaceae bacterium]